MPLQSYDLDMAALGIVPVWIKCRETQSQQASNSCRRF